MTLTNFNFINTLQAFSSETFHTVVQQLAGPKEGLNLKFKQINSGKLISASRDPLR